MLWKEIKSWCKTNGYKADRSKTDKENSYIYNWSKIDDESINGTTTSVSKLAFAIYNHMTNNEHITYQSEYKMQQLEKDISHETEGWGKSF
jgi:hypothetical protein